MPPRRTYVGQRAAAALRDAGVTAPPVSVRALVAYFAIRLVPVRGWPDGAHGQWQPTLREIRFRAEDAEVRQRFTVCHELGHVLLGHDELTFSSVADPESDEYAEDEGKAREREADQFASEVLLPAAWVRDDWARGLRWKELAARYRVSSHAVGIAVDQLRLIG
jgi:Zn-dependent peptidase ImmA (M78 family)